MPCHPVEHELQAICDEVPEVRGPYTVIKPSSMTWYSLGGNDSKTACTWRGKTYSGQISIRICEGEEGKQESSDGSEDSDSSDDSSDSSDSADPEEDKADGEGGKEKEDTDNEEDETLGLLYHDITIKARDLLLEGDAWIQTGNNTVIVGARTKDVQGLECDVVHEEQIGPYHWRETYVARGYKQTQPAPSVIVSPADLEAGTAFPTDLYMGTAAVVSDIRPKRMERFFRWL